ncbi:LysR family transcriptional regulator [Photobacterium halotolerans]|uniref:LysR family transcriptional regulator n=1 Tax=Photobacterium halotolerans TaxID=265726 RepID=UPI0013729B1A|nr:LysR family transcriptional regulator [Photobacterium halotolerans]NAW87095.1 LysR family transcriptional regulator [Photobacterium halotolerans]
MSYLNLPLLHVFHLVAERGSFQAAATELHLPRSSVSKKIRQLEQFIGQPLLHRSTRQLQLTDVGRNLLLGTGDLRAVLSNLHGIIDETQQTPKGRVKISASILMGQRFVVPVLKQLRQTYPDIVIDLSLDDQTVDLLDAKIDIAIRIGQLPDSSLIARKIGDKHWGWFASPRYLAERGRPQGPHELAQHDCLMFENTSSRFNFWPFQDAHGDTETVEVAAAIKTDNSRVLVDMACEGLGIIMVDPAFVRQECQQNLLVPVLTDWRHPERSPIQLVCVGERTKASQAVWQFLLAHWPG